MKKIVPAICISIMIILFAAASSGCTQLLRPIFEALATPSPYSTSAPTEPAQTERPSLVTEAPADVTEAPAYVTEPPEDDPGVTVPDVGSGKFVADGMSVDIDIDCDGLNDRVVFYTEENDDYETYFYPVLCTVKVILGSYPGYEFEFTEYAYSGRLVIVDCDRTDNRLELILNTSYEDGYGEIRAYRVTEKGRDIWESKMYGNLYPDQNGGILRSGCFTVYDYTDVVGTHEISAEYTVDSEGFRRVSEAYTYAENWWSDQPPTVIRPMPAYHVNSDGTIGSAFTVPVGMTLHPLSSDLETYVIVQLASGELAYLELSFGEEYWSILIAGHEQDYYMDLPYAG